MAVSNIGGNSFSVDSVSQVICSLEGAAERARVVGDVHVYSEAVKIIDKGDTLGHKEVVSPVKEGTFDEAVVLAK